MSSDAQGDLLNPHGTEAGLTKAGRFETQLASMAQGLGWAEVCHNVDVFIKPEGRVRSRGIDIVWALENPQSGDREGLLGEAKVHKDQVTLSVVQEELQTLHTKIGKFADRQSFINNEHVREHIDVLRWGVLAHKTEGWDQRKSADTLFSVELEPLHRVGHVTTLAFLGPDTLEAWADCVQLRPRGPEDTQLRPASFYWPAHEEANGVWASCCPPHQLAHGMLAYKTQDQRTVLWVRDTLGERDINQFKEIAWEWQLKVDVVVFSELDTTVWTVRRDAWKAAATSSRDRRSGYLPDVVQARNLTPYTTMNRFNDAWPPELNE